MTRKITLLFTLFVFGFSFSQTFNGATGAIPDNSCSTSNEFPVSVSGVGVLGTTNVFDQVEINITHTWNSDLDISLIAPNGTTIDLSSDNGGSGDNYIGTIFREDAATLITAGVSPFTGFFRPEGDLSTLNGVDADGDWILRVCDDAGGDTGTLNGWSITFVTAPTCVDPDTFVASNVTSNTVDLSWNDPSGIQFDFEYVVQASGVGTPAGSGVAYISGTQVSTVSGISTELDATPLADNTAYEAWVRADCGGGDYSAWVGPINFTTLCNPYTIPYFEGFESGYVDQAAVDGCLSQETITGTQVWTANNTSTTDNRTPRTGAWNAYLRYSNDDWLFIPIDLTGGTSYTVELYARQDGATATNSDITVSYGTTGDAAGMINTIVPATGIVNGNYQQITGSFTPVSTGTYYVGIKGYMNGSPWYISLDDISIDVTPACPAPSGVMASNVTSTTADLSWNATTGNYEYVLDTNAADPAGSGTAIAGETYNATVLTPETTYYFHVRSDCGSTWTTISFTTPAAPPANDDCANAEVLTPGAVFTDNPVVGTNVVATDSGETAPGCASYSGGDVWYSVEVPASGSITIETNSNSDVITDSGLAVYSGTCGSLTLIECDDDDSPDGAFSLVALTSRTPGEILYVNVWEYGNNAFGSMQVSAYDASLSSNSFDSNSFVAYPNPVKNVLTLEYSNEISSVSVYNMLGQEVLSRNIDATSTQIDMSQLNAGTYLVNVTSGDIQKTIKVVKQ